MMLRSHHWYAVAHTICIISLSSSSILCNVKMASSGRNMKLLCWSNTIDTPLRTLYALYPSLPALFCVTWRWHLVAETCSYYVDLIIPTIRYIWLCYRLFFSYLSVLHTQRGWLFLKSRLSLQRVSINELWLCWGERLTAEIGCQNVILILASRSQCSTSNRPRHMWKCCWVMKD